jgi:hypothetical protein
MRKFLSTLLVICTAVCTYSQDLNYYLPDSVSYDPAVPKPKDVIYHEVGEWHVTHDRLMNYMKALAAAVPSRVKFELMGLSYESRPQGVLIITSPKNHQRLEEIRQQHIQLVDPSKSGGLNIDNMPLVVWIGHSIHGNEPSGSNAALLSAYYLSAAQGKKIEDLLENTVILFDAAFNPDGLQRFSTWANQHKSKNLVSDPNSREFSEVWPGGRFNHYWFDLNRDWLPAVHVESQNRLKFYHRWKPNILTDHHEQGSNATFFFQPGVPARANPLTPDKNQELTAKLGKFHAAYLDRIGSLYFTKENYDDYYYGKGSTYPDINGAIGILFEQASSRGHLQETANGLLSFPFTIRNQFVTTLSTLEGGLALRKEFLNWQREFYKTALTQANADPVKGYVIGDKDDRTKTAVFIEMLRRHQIEVFNLNNNFSAEGFSFEKGSAFIVPANQPQHRLIKTIFEKVSTYRDSLFYDVTAWTMPLAFGLPYAELNAARLTPSLQGSAVDSVVYPKGELDGGKSGYAYLFEWDEMLAPKALFELQSKGIAAKVSTTNFTLAGRRFGYGTIVIPIHGQALAEGELYELVRATVEKNGIRAFAVNTGNVTEGSDLGSSRMAVINKPSIAMLVGTGVNATDAGEIWHLLDQRYSIPSTHLELTAFNRVKPERYTTIIMVGGNYATINKEKLKNWVEQGGTLIATEEAVQWVAQSGLTNVSFKKVKRDDSTRLIPYVEREFREGAQRMSGAIFRANVDLTHPLAYGYNYPFVDLFKSNAVFPEKNKNPYSNPFTYGPKPLQSGYITRENYDALKNSAAVLVNAVGSGRVISIADNPNLRAFWLGGSKLFLNAIFFGDVINGASGRNDD